MADGEPEAEGGSYLEKKLVAVSAVYTRFGRDGLRGQNIADVALLLSSKQLEFRDAAKGRDLGEQQKAANRKLELEIQDLQAFMKGHVAGITLTDLRSHGNEQRDQQRQFRPRDRGGRER